MSGLTITNKKSALEHASAILHDARFAASELDFEASSHTFRMRCWVLMQPKSASHGGKRYRSAHTLTF
jgi:hypothetical protein